MIPVNFTYSGSFTTHLLYNIIEDVYKRQLLITPLQIANIVACIANRGYYMTPHIVRPSEQVSNYVEKHIVPIDRKNFEIVIDGMQMAAGGGTAPVSYTHLLLWKPKKCWRLKYLFIRLITTP